MYSKLCESYNIEYFLLLFQKIYFYFFACLHCYFLVIICFTVTLFQIGNKFYIIVNKSRHKKCWTGCEKSKNISFDIVIKSTLGLLVQVQVPVGKCKDTNFNQTQNIFCTKSHCSVIYSLNGNIIVK